MRNDLLGGDLKLSRGSIDLEHWVGVMDGRARNSLVEGRKRDYRRTISNGNSKRSFPASYFSVESILVLFCLTASLLILPLILPPLPPPPFMLLLLPIGILAVLLILAFMPSDVRNVASSYV